MILFYKMHGKRLYLSVFMYVSPFERVHSALNISLNVIKYDHFKESWYFLNYFKFWTFLFGKVLTVLNPHLVAYTTKVIEYLEVLRGRGKIRILNI